MSHATRSRERQRRSTAPLRIRIDKRPLSYTNAYSCVWYVSPRERDIRESNPLPNEARCADEFASYELEIRLSGMYDDGMKVRRLAHKDGEHYESLTDEEFGQCVQDILEHEDVDEDEATDMLTRKGIWPETSMRVFGFDLTYFERMEAAWEAALQFIDFGYTP